MRLRTLAALLTFSTLPAGALAQVPAGGASAKYESYRFSDPAQTGIESIGLLTLPFAARAPLFAGSTLEVAGAWARGTVRQVDGSTATLQGFTDTQVALVLPLRPQLATVTAVAILPTGKERQTAEEAEVAGIVAADLLPFEISNWGAGGGAGMSAAVAHSLGSVGVGASASYLVGRSFDLMDQSGYAYRPGNQLRARVALDAAAGAAGKLSLQLTYLHSNRDVLNGSNLFRSGDRFQAMGSLAFAAGGRASGIVYAGIMHRAQGTYLFAVPTELPSQQLFLGGGGLRLPLGASVLLPSADLRVIRRSDGLQQGVLAGIGGSAELALSSSSVLVVPEARARFGNVVVSEGSQTGFRGFELGIGIRFGGGQP